MKEPELTLEFTNRGGRVLVGVEHNGVVMPLGQLEANIWTSAILGRLSQVELVRVHVSRQRERRQGAKIKEPVR